MPMDANGTLNSVIFVDLPTWNALQEDKGANELDNAEMYQASSG